MAYRLADPSLTHEIETRTQREDAEAAEFHFLLRRPSLRRSAPDGARRVEVLMAMVALSAPVWCPIATYLCSGVGGDASGQLGGLLAGMLGFGVGIGLAVTAICHGALKSRG